MFKHINYSTLREETQIWDSIHQVERTIKSILQGENLIQTLLSTFYLQISNVLIFSADKLGE